MDLTQMWSTPPAPLDDAEMVAIGERLRHLRRQRTVGELSEEEYGEELRTLLERRRHDIGGHDPDRRQAGRSATTSD